MSYLLSNYKTLIFALLILLISCSQALKSPSEKTTSSMEKAAPSSPRTFASPAEAGAALLLAAQSGNRSALMEIFGPNGAEVLFTGDPAQDATNLRDFVLAYTRMNRWGPIGRWPDTLHRSR